MKPQHTTRRAILAGAATLPALAVNAQPADDTLTRIEQHRATQELVGKILQQHSVLEQELPRNRCQAYNIADRGTDIGAEDDPRWTAFQAEYWSAEDRLAAIAWSFVDRPPITIAGASALLAYANEYEARGYDWPDRRHFFEPDGSYSDNIAEDWRLSMNKALASVLAGIA